MSRFDNLFNVAKGKDATTPPDDLSGVDKLSKSKDPNYVRTTIYLPRELHRKLKTQATIDGEEMSQIIRPLAKKIYAIIKNFHFQTKSVNS